MRKLNIIKFIISYLILVFNEINIFPGKNIFFIKKHAHAHFSYQNTLVRFYFLHTHTHTHI